MHWPLDPAAFAAVFLFLYVAHGIADHYLQTGRQAADKSKSGWPGRKACAEHVEVYTLCASAFVVAAVYLFNLDVGLWGLLAGQAISAATHYWADRRFTLERFCDRIGKGDFYRLGRPRDARAWTRLNAGEHDGDEHDVDLYIPGVDGPTSWDNPTLGTGAYALDQWWHIGWLLVAAGVTVWL